MNLCKKIIALFFIIVTAVAPTFVFADPYGIDSAAQGTTLLRTNQSVPEIIGSVIGVALSFVGVIFFVLILYAGFTWMTAFGNEEKVTTSKSIMEHAAIGLVIVLAAYAISQFLFHTLVDLGSNNGSTANPGTTTTSP